MKTIVISKVLVGVSIFSMFTTGCTAEFQNAVSTLAKTVNEQLNSVQSQTVENAYIDTALEEEQDVAQMIEERNKRLTSNPELAAQLNALKDLSQQERQAKMAELKEENPELFKQLSKQRGGQKKFNNQHGKLNGSSPNKMKPFPSHFKHPPHQGQHRSKK